MENAPTAHESASTRRRVLVIDDDDDIRDVLVFNLEGAGYQVQFAATGEDGLRAWSEFQPHVILLDVMLPGIQGTDVCRQIRADKAAQPAIIMLSARTDEIDRVVGFEIGANDYVVKPFSVRELLLRVRSVLRSHGPPEVVADDTGPKRPQSSGDELQLGPLRVDIAGHQTFVDGKEVMLSVLEMRLLVYLLRGEGRVCTRDRLLADVWGYQRGVTTRTVDAHIKRLRDKLGGAGDLIRTVRGMGYRLSD